ncbi:MAG: lipoate--protein ligase family protein [Lentisphaerae bacterium]|nr:lipoate--protein ligase family protein [Lentisphaerota bacterium]
MQILFSSETDPALNAAIEEQLFRASPLQPTLLFYRNTPAVLLGRNQNPWQECNLRWCRNNGVSILRRLSGGGTVFHDLGNLNYAFIIARDDYDQQRYLRCIISALQAVGIDGARICDHFSIWVGNHKVAGSAFALSGRAALLHGCILVKTDLEQLRLALHQDPRDHFTATTVASVRVPVKNLSEINRALSCASVRDAICRAAQSLGSEGSIESVAADNFSGNSAFATAVSNFTSEGWTYNRTADFILERQCPNGSARLDVSQGRIRQATLRSPDGCHNLPQLQGLRLDDALDTLEQLPLPDKPKDKTSTHFTTFP